MLDCPFRKKNKDIVFSLEVRHGDVPVPVTEGQVPWQEPVMVNFLFKPQQESCYIHCEEEDGTRTQTPWFIKGKPGENLHSP